MYLYGVFGGDLKIKNRNLFNNKLLTRIELGENYSHPAPFIMNVDKWKRNNIKRNNPIE